MLSWSWRSLTRAPPYKHNRSLPTFDRLVGALGVAPTEKDSAAGYWITLMKACIFCGSAPTTREHVLPQWMAKKLQARDGMIHDSRRPGEARTALNGFDMLVKCACGPTCNNGWMERLEHEVRPFLGELILGQRIELNPLQQDALARWLWKTAIVQDAGLGKRENFFRKSDAEDFFRTQTVPANARMWIGGYVHDRRSALIALRVWTLAARPITVGRALVFTIAIGKIVVQVLATRAGRAHIAADDPQHTYQTKNPVAVKFWPPTGRAIKRTGFGVPDSSFEGFAGRFDNMPVLFFDS